MTSPRDPSFCSADPHDISHNDSPNEHFDSVLRARLSRRDLLRGGVATAAGAMLGTLGLASHAAIADAPVADAVTGAASPAPSLGFQAVAKSLADAVVVPAGYTAAVLYALGDPLRSATPPYGNNGTDTDFENRAGDHHDGMEYFGLSDAGTPLATSSSRGLLVINHEASSEEFPNSFSSHFLHVGGGTATLPRPVSEMDKEVAVHGISIVEIRKTGSSWRYVQDSPFNRRITPLTGTTINGPVRGNAQLITKFSPNGTRTRGTLNNCGGGRTPWGTYVAGEENWPDYFFRNPGDTSGRRADQRPPRRRRHRRHQDGPSGMGRCQSGQW